MKNTIIKLLLLNCLFASFISSKPKTTKEFFRQHHWEYPICFDLPTKIPESSGCGLGKIYDKMLFSFVQNNTVKLNTQIVHFFKAELKTDTNTNTAFRISDPILCQMDTNENVQLLVTLTEYNQSKSKVKFPKDSPLSAVFKIENAHIYSISKAAIFKIKGDSLVFFDWWR